MQHEWVRRLAVAVATVALTSTMAVSGMGAANAAPKRDAFGILAAQQPGITRAQVRAEMRAAAKGTDVTPKQLARAVLRQMDSDKAAAAGARGSGTDKSARIRLPRARQMGDVVYAPNSSRYLPHGHSAIYVRKNRIVHALGGKQVVSNHRVDRKKASAFAPAALLMEIRTKKGKGPLLSKKKRKKAADWAKSRVGDKYRHWSKRNALVVKGKPGSKDTEQNCSQLVWAAYKVANNYDFNPVEKLQTPANMLADKLYVTPLEITQAEQTVAYAKVTEDPYR